MRHVGTITSFVLAALLCVPHGSAAQSPLELSVERAVARAIEAAPRLAEAREREAAADAAVASRQALGRPSIVASSAYLRSNHVDEFGIPQANGTTRIIFPDIPNNYQARAEMTVPVYTAGRVSDLVASAEAGRRAAEADRRATSADVTLETVTAYWTVVTARERAGVLERTLERADASLADVRSRVDAGILPPNDALTAEAQRARQRVQLIQAQNDAAVAEAELARLVGAEPGQRLVLTTPAARPAPGAAEIRTRAPADLARQAAEARPERQALAARSDALRAAADAAWAAVRPQVGVMAGIEPARPNARFVPRVDTWHTSWDLAVNVRWNIWDGGRARADRAASVAEANALTHRVDEFDARLGVEVRQRTLEIASAEAALAASAEAVAAATEARRVLGERFSVGVATSTELLDADVALLEAELERTRLFASLRVAEARLMRTVGTP
jgi:outer membrane protein